MPRSPASLCLVDEVDNARELVGIERYAAAVLLAQAAVEMGTRNALVGMLVDRYGELSDDDVKQLLPGSLSFLEDDCRVLWKALTGERVSRPKDPPVWPSCEQHVHYRDAIAHGSMLGDRWGFESVAAAGQFRSGGRCARQHDELAGRLVCRHPAVRVDRLLERIDRVDVRRHLAALDLLDDGAQ